MANSNYLPGERLAAGFCEIASRLTAALQENEDTIKAMRGKIGEVKGRVRRIEKNRKGIKAQRRSA
jgi:hypothetical protein